MRAARYHDYGPPEVLGIEDAPEPRPGPGEIRVRARAASVNPLDWKIRAGQVRDHLDVMFPAVPGRDAAGTVDEVGAGVTGVAPGDTVFGLGGVSGGAAEHVVLDAWAPVPPTWTVEQAAGAGLTVATAATALDALGDLQDRTLLVEGAAGGVGSVAVEIAVARGATVVGTASAANHAFLAELGARPTTYGPGLADRVAALAPGGVDAVVDTAGSGSLGDLVSLARHPDRVVTVADLTGAETLGVRHLWAVNDSRLFADAAALGARGLLTPRVSRTYALEDIAHAHAQAESGHTRGKIVLTIA